MKGSISISEKAVLSIIEASEYSEIGQDRLKKLCDKPNCSFSFRVGNRRSLIILFQMPSLLNRMAKLMIHVRKVLI